MLSRRRLLLLVLLACLGASALLWGIERWLSREEPNYSPIEEGLYLGGFVRSPPGGTDAVLNLAEWEDPYACAVHLWEPIKDGAPAPTIDWLERMVVWVDARRRAGDNVYVHCFAGVSRSALVTAAYLMFKNSWTREQALDFLRSKRPRVRPNDAFMELLGEWETVLASR